MSNHFIDTLRGISTLKAFGASKAYGDTIYDVSEDFRRATVRTLRVATLNGAVMDLLTTIGVAAVAIMLGFGLMEGSVSLYVGLVCLILAPEYFKPIREFSSDFHASLDGKNALASVVGLLYEDASTYAEEQVAIPGWDERSYLAFENVHFAYPVDDADDDDGADGGEEDAPRVKLGPEVLKDISFMARGYEKIGIVGISGSGKSTLVNLLGGFELPTGGSIDLDGVRLGSMRQQGWQDQVFHIPQDPYIFHASLRDNIVFYSPDASDGDVERVIETVGLGQLVAELPDGLDTLIGEGGRGLSGGQAQRIALARVLLDSSRKVLLFDEPTAHLDIETELELKQRMLGLMEGHLVIFATHRLHWMADMDEIWVLADGTVAERGTLEELLAHDGAFCALARQLRGDGADGPLTCSSPTGDPLVSDGGGERA
jgi:ATP-binding cassette subfamily C protein CydD